MLTRKYINNVKNLSSMLKSILRGISPKKNDTVDTRKPDSPSDIDAALGNRISLELETIQGLAEGYSKNRPNEHYAIHHKKIISYLGHSRVLLFLRTIDELSKKIDLSGKTILDIGTFFPYLLYMISKRHEKCRLLGFDLNNDALNFGKYILPEAFFYQQDFFNSNENFDNVDLIICTQVLEHLVHPDRALKKMLSIRNNQAIFISIPDGRQDNLEAGYLLSDQNSYSGHINFWSPESWRLFLEANCDMNNCKIITGSLGKNLHAIIIKR